MFPSKATPTISAFMLITGLPEAPPVTSAVQIKFIGVDKSNSGGVFNHFSSAVHGNSPSKE